MALLHSNTEINENEDKVQNEGLSLLVTRTVLDVIKTEMPCQQLCHYELVCAMLEIKSTIMNHAPGNNSSTIVLFV